MLATRIVDQRPDSGCAAEFGQSRRRAQADFRRLVRQAADEWRGRASGPRTAEDLRGGCAGPLTSRAELVDPLIHEPEFLERAGQAVGLTPVGSLASVEQGLFDDREGTVFVATFEGGREGDLSGGVPHQRGLDLRAAPRATAVAPVTPELVHDNDQGQRDEHANERENRTGQDLRHGRTPGRIPRGVVRTISEGSCLRGRSGYLKRRFENPQKQTFRVTFGR